MLTHVLRRALLAGIACLTFAAAGCSGANDSSGLPDKGVTQDSQPDGPLEKDALAAADSQSSQKDHGQPMPDGGAPKSDAGGLPKLVINEVAPKGTPDDWFEVYNPSANAIALDGWSFTDDVAGKPQRATFVSGLSVPPKGYLQVVIDASYGFSLGSDEELGVFDPSGALIDKVDWNKGDADTGQSWGRVPDVIGAFQTLTTPSPGKGND